MLRSLARRLGWMAIKRFIVLLSRAGQAGAAVQCTALPPSMYLHIYFVPSTLTPNITGKSKISLWDCLFLLIAPGLELFNGIFAPDQLPCVF